MIELALTPTALIQRSGGFVTAGVAGQTVQLAPSAEWQGLRLNIRFSDGWHVRDVAAASDGSAEIPLDVISAPWRSLSMSVAGFDAAGRRALGSVWCKLGYTLPEGTQTGGGSAGSAGSGTGDEKTFVAEYGVTTAQEIIDFLDATKEPFAPMLVKRGDSYYTVTTAAKQGADKAIIRTFATLSGNYHMFTYTIAGNTWASSSHGFQPMLVSGTNIKTVGGQSLLGSGDIPIPDTTGMATQAWVQQYIAALDASGTGY